MGDVPDQNKGPRMRQLARALLLVAAMAAHGTPASAEGEDLTGTRWRLSGLLPMDLVFIQCRAGQPVRAARAIGSEEPQERYSGTYDGKTLILSDSDVNAFIGQKRTLRLKITDDGRRLTGTETDTAAGSSDPVEFGRVGGGGGTGTGGSTTPPATPSSPLGPVKVPTDLGPAGLAGLAGLLGLLLGMGAAGAANVMGAPSTPSATPSVSPPRTPYKPPPPSPECEEMFQRYSGYDKRIQKVIDEYDERRKAYDKQIDQIRYEIDPKRKAGYEYLSQQVSPKVERLMYKCHALLGARTALGAFIGAAGFDIISIVAKDMAKWSTVRWFASWSGSAPSFVNSLFAAGSTVGETTVAGALTAADAELAVAGGAVQAYGAGTLRAWAVRSAAGACGALLIYASWEFMKKAVKDTIVDKTVLAKIEQWQKDAVDCATEIVTLERSAANELTAFKQSEERRRQIVGEIESDMGRTRYVLEYNWKQAADDYALLSSKCNMMVNWNYGSQRDIWPVTIPEDPIPENEVKHMMEGKLPRGSWVDFLWPW